MNATEVHLTADLAYRLAVEVEKAEARAKALHDAGRCHESKWSCSYCEADQ